VNSAVSTQKYSVSVCRWRVWRCSNKSYCQDSGWDGAHFMPLFVRLDSVVRRCKNACKSTNIWVFMKQMSHMDWELYQPWECAYWCEAWEKLHLYVTWIGIVHDLYVQGQEFKPSTTKQTKKYINKWQEEMHLLHFVPKFCLVCTKQKWYIYQIINFSNCYEFNNNS
jgi:hypothetical protein